MPPSTWILAGVVVILTASTAGEKRSPREWIPVVVRAGLLFPVVWVAWWGVSPYINRALGHASPKFWRYSDQCYLQQHGQWFPVADAKEHIEVGDICSGEGAYWQLDVNGNWQKIQ